jgi:hypothetical protein
VLEVPAPSPWRNENRPTPFSTLNLSINTNPYQLKNHASGLKILGNLKLFIRPNPKSDVDRNLT